MNILKMRFFRFLTIPALFIAIFAFGSSEAFAVTPLQSCESMPLTTDVAYGCTMGYKFTPTVNGQVTKLGGYFNGTKTVRLFDSNYNVLASASVTAANTWSYTAIAPVALSSGLVYYVVVDVAGSGGTYGASLNPALPSTCNNITIQITVTQNPSGTFNASHTETAGIMYGFADIEFTTGGAKGAAPVAQWRFDEGGGTTAYNESNANSLNILKIDAGSAVSAATAETMCAAQGGYLFVPRNPAYLRAVIDWLGGGSPNDTETNKWLYIMGIYPKYNGATWISQAMNTGNSNITWHANDDGPFYVSTRTDITEPNGDNSTVSSMYYAWSGYNITWYNDCGAPGYTSRYFLCQLQTNGTISGATWVQGKIGKALQFNGTNGYASVPNTSILQPASAMTISFWMNMTSIQGGWQTVVGKNPYSGGYLVFMESGGTLLRYLANINSTEYRLNSSFAPALNTWYHVSFVVDPANTIMKSYINGVFDASVAIPNGTVTHNANPLSFAGGGANYFNGIIDDVRIYNYARTPDQILVDYNNGAAARTGVGVDPNEGSADPFASCVGYWPLDENTGTTAYDRSGNGKNITLTNGPVWAPGKKGPCVSFDGIDDYASIPSSVTSGLSQFTVCLWIKTTESRTNGTFWLRPTIFGQSTGGAPSGDGGVTTNNGYIGFWTGLNSGGDNSFLSTTRQINDNAWHYIVLVNNGSTATLYVDNVAQGSLPTGMSLNSDSFWIGGKGGSESPGYYHQGFIDDVKIYNYARSQAQISYDYNKGAPVAQYKFDEGGGPIAHNEYSSADTGIAPVGWWMMDLTWADASGKGNNGTPNGGVSFQSPSKIGPWCCNFNGTDGYIVHSTSGMSSRHGTVTGWVKPNATSSWGFWQTHDSSSYNWVDWIVMMSWVDGTFYFRMGNGSDCCSNDLTFSTASYIPAGVWSRLAFTWEDTTMKAYVNGVLIASKTNAVFQDTIDPWARIGCGHYQYMNGLIDDLRVYNYARTPKQIYDDYITTHGTLVNHAKFVDGKIGNALQFDGSDDYVSVPSISIADNITVSAWVYSANFNSTMFVVQKEPVNTQWELFFEGNLKWRTSGGEITCTPPSNNNWHFVAATQSGTTATLYIDGIQTATGTIGAFGNGTGSIDIGRHESGYYFNGKIDDVRIYNYARTADQVLQDYNAGSAARFGAPSAGTADPWAGALPVAYWNLDENTGALAKDSSGNGNNGSLINSPAWAPGKNGPALKFNGTNQTVSAVNSSSLNITGQNLTLEAWINPSSGAGDGDIIHKEGQYTIFRNSNGTITYADSTIWNYATVGQHGSTPSSQWSHVAVTRDVSSVKFYINGKYIDSYSCSGSISGNGNSVYIGCYNGGPSWFNGLIDDVKIYNYTRTPAQVAWDYNMGKPFAHYRFNEATSGSAVGTNNIKDDSGNGNPGSGVGAVSWTTGKFGGALNFNGSGDYVQLPGAQALQLYNSSFTAEAWIKGNAYSGDNGVFATDQTGYNVGLHLTIRGAVPYMGFYSNDIGGATTLSPGIWYHIAWRYDISTGEQAIFVNGKLDNAGTGHPAFQGTDNIKIGREFGGSYFNGIIDDARIYNYARTADQIQQDCNSGAAARLGD